MTMHFRNVVGAAALTATLSLGLLGCLGHDDESDSGGTNSGASVVTGSAGNASAASRTPIKFALPAGQKPNWIFPMVPTTAAGNYTTIQMWRPLFWFGDKGQAKFNPSISIAEAPVFSNGGKTATIKLKPYKWSDGERITTRDVEFWINLLTAAVKADATAWIGYSPGGFPENVKEFKYTSETEFSVTFKQPYNRDWLLFNVLSQIYAIPQHAWDKTSNSGAVADHDRTPAGAKAVWEFLSAQSKSLSTWGTNPIWQVVDGPYKIKSFDPGAGNVAFVPNENYTGPHSPNWGPYELHAFTSDAAETTALLSGQLDVGYVPFSSLGLNDRLNSTGFKIAPQFGMTIVYQSVNLNNPRTGSMLSQLYVRQAMQRLVNQPQIIKTAIAGYGVPTYGPVPTGVPNPFASPSAKTNPYPFDPAQAAALLREHGWTVNAGGVSTCTNPGTGGDQCGAGVAKGARLSFSVKIASGLTFLARQTEQIRTDFSKAGIELKVRQVPITEIYSTTACDPKTNQGCDWDMVNSGGGWTFNAPGFMPTGEVLYATGGGGNVSGYSDPTADKLIKESTASNDEQAVFAYQDYIAKQLPALWMPAAANRLTAVSNSVTGVVPQDPYLQIYPELWSKGGQ